MLCVEEIIQKASRHHVMSLLPRRVLLMAIVLAQILATTMAINNNLPCRQEITRLDFMIRSLMLTTSSSLGPSSLTSSTQMTIGTQQPPHGKNIEIPLKFLPNGGCWAMKVAISDKNFDQIAYYAIVDSASPFITTPITTKFQQLLSKRPRRREYSHPTFEQYGDIVGKMEWRQADYVSVVGRSRPSSSSSSDDNMGGTTTSSVGIVEERSNVVLGMASPEVIENTGGIFVGLMDKDENRPTFLQQFGYNSFTIDFIQPTLYLSSDSLIMPLTDIFKESTKDETTLSTASQISKASTLQQNWNIKKCYILDLFDLQPYGPNVHHYGVLCNQIDLQLSTTKKETDDFTSVSGMQSTIHVKSVATATLSRPVVAVLDTGLTGCVLSDTLYAELFNEADSSKPSILGITVSLCCSPSSTTTKAVSSGENSSDVDKPRTIKSRNGNVSTDKSMSTIDLSSCSNTNQQYWRWSTFHLPWFYDEDDEQELPPHVIALGNTFWTNGVKSLTIDTITQKALIELC